MCHGITCLTKLVLLLVAVKNVTVDWFVYHVSCLDLYTNAWSLQAVCMCMYVYCCFLYCDQSSCDYIYHNISCFSFSFIVQQRCPMANTVHYISLFNYNYSYVFWVFMICLYCICSYFVLYQNVQLINFYDILRTDSL